MHYIPFQARPCGPPCCTSPRAFHAHSTPVLHCASAVGSTGHGRSAQRPTSHSLSRDPGRENRNPLAPTAWTQPSRKRSPPTAPRLSALAFSTPAIPAHSERLTFLWFTRPHRVHLGCDAHVLVPYSLPYGAARIGTSTRPRLPIPYLLSMKKTTSDSDSSGCPVSGGLHIA